MPSAVCLIRKYWLQRIVLALPGDCCVNTAVLFQVKRWQEEQRKLASSEGIVRTMLGRERRLPAAMDGKNSAAKGHALRAAINTPIQVDPGPLRLFMPCRVGRRMNSGYGALCSSCRACFKLLLSRQCPLERPLRG